MIVDVSKYLDDNTVLIENYNTWPIEIKEYIEDNKKLLVNYYDKVIEIELLKIKDKEEDVDPVSFEKNYINEYSEDYRVVYNKVKELLEKYYILSFHATRLLKEELHDVKMNGLKFGADCCNDKLNLLSNYSFSDVEIMELKNTQKKTLCYEEKKIYFFHTSSQVKYDGLDLYVKYWGGEEFSRNAINTNIGKKIKGLGKAYVLITKILLKDASFLEVCLEPIIKSIIYNKKIKACFSNIKNKRLQIIDYIEIKENDSDEIIFKA